MYYNQVYLVCDNCRIYFDDVYESIREARRQAERRGWSYKKVGNLYQDLCYPCGRGKENGIFKK